MLPHLPCYQDRLYAVYDGVRILHAELIVLDTPADDTLSNLVRRKLLHELKEIAIMVANFYGSNVVSSASLCEELLKILGVIVQSALPLLRGGGGVERSARLTMLVEWLQDFDGTASVY